MGTDRVVNLLPVFPGKFNRRFRRFSKTTTGFNVITDVGLFF